MLERIHECSVPRRRKGERLTEVGWSKAVWLYSFQSKFDENIYGIKMMSCGRIVI